MTTIWGIMAYWNEEFYIRQSIYAALPFVSKLLLVDGAYYQEGLDSHWSTDKTNSCINRIIYDDDIPDMDIWWYTDEQWNDAFPSMKPHDYVKVKYKGWKDEMEKRQFMLDCVPEGDVIFIIDADTLTVGDPNWFREQVEVMISSASMVPTMEYVHPAGWWDTPMLLKKVKGMQYKGTHWNIEYPDTDGNQWIAPNNMQDRIEGVFQLNMGAFYRQPTRFGSKITSRVSRSKKEDFGDYQRKKLKEEMYDARRQLYEDPPSTE